MRTVAGRKTGRLLNAPGALGRRCHPGGFGQLKLLIQWTGASLFERKDNKKRG